MTLLYIALGGAVGAVARFGLGGWVQDRTGFAFPWGTLVVNVLGCLLVGFAIRHLEAVRVEPEVRALITVGLVGSFTTFSTFSYEAVALLETGAWTRAALYSLGSLVLGIAAVFCGVWLSAYILQPSS